MRIINANINMEDIENYITDVLGYPYRSEVLLHKGKLYLRNYGSVVCLDVWHVIPPALREGSKMIHYKALSLLTSKEYEYSEVKDNVILLKEGIGIYLRDANEKDILLYDDNTQHMKPDKMGIIHGPGILKFLSQFIHLVKFDEDIDIDKITIQRMKLNDQPVLYVRASRHYGIKAIQ